MRISRLTVQTSNSKFMYYKSNLPIFARSILPSRIRLTDDEIATKMQRKDLTKIMFKTKDIIFNMICLPKDHLIMGQTEVTQGLYEAVMGYNPSEFKDGRKTTKNPVERVTWFDAVVFCNKLSQMLRKKEYYQISNIEFDYITPKDSSQKVIYLDNIRSADVWINPNANGFRLPTEKEWQYAAKADTGNKWAGCNNEKQLKKYAWFDENSNEKTHPVKAKLPNEWGFYDMSGNVDEWCYDEMIDHDTKIPNLRITHGGSHNEDSMVSEISYRGFFPEGDYDSQIGFRIAASLI